MRAVSGMRSRRWAACSSVRSSARCLALRICPDWAGRRFARVTGFSSPGVRLLAGSLWLFLVGVGLPVGLQTGRVLLAHLSTPGTAVPIRVDGADLWVCWSVLSTAGAGLLADLREEAGSHRRDGSDVVATYRRSSPGWRRLLRCVSGAACARGRRRCCPAGGSPYPLGSLWHSACCCRPGRSPAVQCAADQAE